jgi:hypothetical protein
MSLAVYLICLFLSYSSAKHISSPVAIAPIAPVAPITPVVPVPLAGSHPFPVVATDGKMESIVAGGTNVAKVITAKLVAPYVFGASKVAGFAGALPPLMAANGAFIGKLIATPIEIAAAASSGVVSGITGFLVGIPVGMGTGAVVAAHVLQQKFNSLANQLHALPNLINTLPGGHQLMQPVALIDGGQAFLLGSTAKLVGVKMQALGERMTSGHQMTPVGGQAIPNSHPVLIEPIPAAHGSSNNVMDMIPLPILMAIKGIVDEVNKRDRGAIAALIPFPGHGMGPVVRPGVGPALTGVPDTAHSSASASAAAVAISGPPSPVVPVGSPPVAASSAVAAASASAAAEP